MFDRFKYHPLIIRLRSWEFWPAWLINIPVIGIWLIQGIRARALFFFSAINPGIHTGGMLGESKFKILSHIPRKYLPTTIFIARDTSPATVLSKLRKAGITFPCVAKPDIGERGFLVEVLEDADALKQYLRKSKVDTLIQEFVDLPMEFSILCHVMPQSGETAVTSVCMKEFLQVTGDGQSTVDALIRKQPRAILQYKQLKASLGERMHHIPAHGEVIPLQPIGNHCRGTKFLNANHLIDHALTDIFTGILQKMPGLNYGRFDLKAQSINDLRKGRNFRILEFNGVASEPAHIYDPEYPVIKGYRDIWMHWDIMRNIYLQQNANGVSAMNLREAWRSLVYYIRYKRTAKAELE